MGAGPSFPACRQWGSAARAAVVSGALALASMAAADEGYEWQSDLIHSELPLYSFEWDDLWPRSFNSGVGQDFEFGCESRVDFGDWAFAPNPHDEDGDAGWYRFTNYGAFHCAAIIRTASERGELADRPSSTGFFVRIGEGRRAGERVELWALQSGLRPGSSYLLLARRADESGTVQEFSVLQTRCPRANVRETRSFDIFGTRYCLINSRAELLAVARRMLREPELGTLRRVSEPPAPKDGSPRHGGAPVPE